MVGTTGATGLNSNGVGAGAGRLGDEGSGGPHVM